MSGESESKDKEPKTDQLKNSDESINMRKM